MFKSLLLIMTTVFFCQGMADAKCIKNNDPKGHRTEKSIDGKKTHKFVCEVKSMGYYVKPEDRAKYYDADGYCINCGCYSSKHDNT